MYFYVILIQEENNTYTQHTATNGMLSFMHHARRILLSLRLFYQHDEQEEGSPGESSAERTPFLNEDDLVKVVFSCTRLRELHLIHCIHISDDFFARAFCRAKKDAESSRYLATLRVLDIRGCTAVTDQGLIQIAKFHPKLRCIRVGNLSLSRDSLQLNNLDHRKPWFEPTYGNNRSPCLLRSDLAVSSTAKASSSAKKFLCRISDIGVLHIAQCCCHNVLELDISGCPDITDQAIEHIMEYCSCIEEFYFGSCRQITDFGMQAFVSVPNISGRRFHTHAKQMRVISCANTTNLSGVGIAWLVSGCFGLTSLDISYCPLIDDFGVRSLSALTNLKDLNLSGCTHVTDAALPCVIFGETRPNSLSKTARQASMLRQPISFATILLSRCPFIGEETCKGLTAACHTTLTRLEMGGCGSLSEGTLKHMFRHCTLLTKLDISGGNASITPKAVQVLTRHMDHLRFLDVSSTLSFDTRAIHHLRNLRFLDTLVCHQCSALDDNALKHLPPMLKSLYISANNTISDVGMRTIAALALSDSLELLDLSHCRSPSLSRDGILCLLRTCFKLRTVNLHNCCDSVIKSADLFALRHQSAEYLTLATGPDFFGICLRPDAVSEEYRSLFSRHDDLVNHSANTIRFWWKVWSNMKEQRERRQRELLAKHQIALCLQSRLRRQQGQKQAHQVYRAKMAFAEGMQRKYRKAQCRNRRVQAINMWGSRLLYKLMVSWKSYTRDSVAAKGHASYQVLCKKALGHWRFRVLHSIITAWSSYALPRQAKMKHAMCFWRNHVIVKFWPQWRDTARAHKVRRHKLADMTLLLFPLHMWNSCRHQASVHKAEHAAYGFFKQFVKRNIFPALKKVR
jgi:hypothetical protein